MRNRRCVNLLDFRFASSNLRDDSVIIKIADVLWNALRFDTLRLIEKRSLFGEVNSGEGVFCGRVFNVFNIKSPLKSPPTTESNRCCWLALPSLRRLP